MRTNILGVGFDDLTLDEALGRAMELIERRGSPGCFLCTPNPEIVWNARKNKDLAGALAAAHLVLADGVGVIYAARILKKPLRQRLPGIDFAYALLERLTKAGKSVFLLGAAPGVAEAAADALKARFPGLRIAGTQHGYFSDDGPVLSAINASGADFVMVCLGSPKQELWMLRNRDKLSVGLMAGLGGSLDVMAGKVQRAPVFWQKNGVEWLYRLLKEPKRIRRMAALPLFLLAAAHRRLKREG